MKRAPRRKQRQIIGSKTKKNRCQSNGSSFILFSANSFEDVFGDVRAAINNSTARQDRGKSAFLGNLADCLQDFFTDRIEEFLFPFGNAFGQGVVQGPFAVVIKARSFFPEFLLCLLLFQIQGSTSTGKIRVMGKDRVKVNIPDGCFGSKGRCRNHGASIPKAYQKGNDDCHELLFQLNHPFFMKR